MASNGMRIVLLTSTAPRHRFLADALARTLDLVGTVSEVKRAAPAGSEEAQDQLPQDHLRSRDAAEQKFFGHHTSFPGRPGDLEQIEAGRVNNQEVTTWIKNRQPDAVVLFGSSIIREPLLSLFSKRMINLHLGLSPYYRGTATNFWPLVNREPECVGATIHLVARRVDAGGILAQTRPSISEKEGCHEIGCSALIAGAAALPETIKAFLAGGIRPQVQDLYRGKVFTRTDFSVAAVMRMRDHFASRMIPEYLADKEARDARFPIVALS